MPIHDDFGLRMKTYYEQIPKTKLMRRCPVAIRIDGKAFHTFTKGFKRPFDHVLGNAMIHTMEYLCKNIQGACFGYTQSDEITLILIDYQTFTTDAWFDYEVQKMTSIAASMATMAFSKFFQVAIDEEDFAWRTSLTPQSVEIQQEHQKYMETLQKAADKGAMFDARVFNIPREEVTNLIYWRQLDATRNSIQMVGQANFSHSELQGKSCNNIQDMLMERCSINWNNYPTRYKRGVACYKTIDQDSRIDIKDGAYPRSYWIVDYEMPILKGEDRAYVDKHIFVGEE